jgi:hypothetical protein
VQLGEPVNLKVVLEGIGNLKSARVPKPNFPAGLKPFDPTATDKEHTQGGRYGGTKTIEWILNPQQTGDFVIPPVEMPIFDPSKGEYTVATTEPIPLHVSPAPGGTPISKNGEVTQPVATNVLSGGVRPIRIQPDVVVPAPPIWRRTLFWPVTAAPLFAWAFIFAGTFVMNSLRKRDPNRLKERRAHSAASRRLKAAQGFLAANDANGFHAEIARSLQQFVIDKTGVEVLGLTRDELGRTLTERGYPRPQVVALVHILEKCENARFAPSAELQQDMANLLDQATRTLDALESTKPTGRPS